MRPDSHLPLRVRHCAERALAVGATGAITWELAEYFAFITRTSARSFAYGDTLGDLAPGTAGAVVAGVVVHRLWRRGLLHEPARLPTMRESAPT